MRSENWWFYMEWSLCLVSNIFITIPNHLRYTKLQYGRGCWTRGQNIALIRTVRFCVRTLISRFCNSYEDGTSTNREPHQTYKTAEVGYSQLWAQSWVMLAYVLLDRTGNGFHIKVSVMLNQSKPALVQTQVSK